MFETVNNPEVAVELTAADKSAQVVPLSTLPCNLNVLAVDGDSAQLNNSICTPLIAIGPTTLGVILNNSFPTQFCPVLNAE